MAADSGRGSAAAAAALSEINVTPFVDVVLVLLILYAHRACDGIRHRGGRAPGALREGHHPGNAGGDYRQDRQTIRSATGAGSISMISWSRSTAGIRRPRACTCAADKDATGMPRASVGGVGPWQSPGVYGHSTDRFRQETLIMPSHADTLVDSPIELGTFRSTAFQVCGVPHRYAIGPPMP